MLLDSTTYQAQNMSNLYQLKQMRSKIDHLSTYTMCRASSNVASRLEMQPTTIWTLSDQANATAMTQARVASLLFWLIAIGVIKKGRGATMAGLTGERRRHVVD